MKLIRSLSIHNICQIYKCLFYVCSEYLSLQVLQENLITKYLHNYLLKNMLKVVLCKQFFKKDRMTITKLVTCVKSYVFILEGGRNYMSCTYDK